MKSTDYTLESDPHLMRRRSMKQAALCVACGKDTGFAVKDLLLSAVAPPAEDVLCERCLHMRRNRRRRRQEV